MPKLLLHILVFSAFLASCSTQKKIVTDSKGNPIPEITWEVQKFDLGDVYLGDTRDLEYTFTNTGSADLEIELVTTCKCTAIDWPRQPIPPGGIGKITATYDSTNQKLGPITKTIDIIANTDPIVVEAFFDVNVLYRNNYKK